MHGEKYDSLSADTADVKDPTLLEFSTESLQGIQLRGLPLSKLLLKVGASVMSLRNLDHPDGLNNKPRMIITRVGRHCLKGQLLGEDHDGKLRIIPDPVDQS